MQLLSAIDTTTFVLVTLTVFIAFNVAVFCWFRFFAKKAHEGDMESVANTKFKQSAEENSIEDLPF